MIRFLILITLFVWALQGIAQQNDSLVTNTPPTSTPKTKAPTIGLGLTGNTYTGDYTDKFMQYNRIQPGMNLSLQPSFSRLARLRPQLNTGFGTVEEQADGYPFLTLHDPFVRDVRVVHTTFFYGDIRMNVAFLRKSRLSPYVGSGFGILLFSPQDADGNLLIEAPKTRPKGEEYNTFTFYVPATLGLTCRLSRALSLGVSYVYRNTFTDYIDNVGKLGIKKGNDALHQLQLSMYLSPVPPPSSPIDNLPPIYIPPTPKDSTQTDSTWIASVEKLPKKRKIRKPKYLPYEPPVADTARQYFVARPLDSVVLSILDTTEIYEPPMTLKEIFVFDSVTIYMDSAIAYKEKIAVYPAIRKAEIQQVQVSSITGLEYVVKATDLAQPVQYNYEITDYPILPITQQDSVQDTISIVTEKWSPLENSDATTFLNESEQIERENKAIELRKFLYHEVRPMETLQDIAKKYGVRPETIQRINGMTRPNLRVGTSLRIPDIK